MLGSGKREWDVFISSWAVMSALRASHRVPLSPDDFLAGSDLSLQPEKEKIRQSSLYFSLLKEEGGNEIRTGEIFFFVFSLFLGQWREWHIGQSCGLYCAVAIFLPLWRWWITRTPANMLEINNSSDGYGSLRVCWVLNICSESSHTLWLSDAAWHYFPSKSLFGKLHRFQMARSRCEQCIVWPA